VGLSSPFRKDNLVPHLPKPLLYPPLSRPMEGRIAIECARPCRPTRSRRPCERRDPIRRAVDVVDGAKGLVEPARRHNNRLGLWVPAFAGTTVRDFQTSRVCKRSLSLRISGVRVREHFNYVNTTLQNSGCSVVTPMDYVLEPIKAQEHGRAATAFS
jgi:hypothetical protein